MRTIYYVQPYTVKGTRMIGCPAMGFAYADEALTEGRRLAPWRTGVVVHRQDIDAEAGFLGRPEILAIHGRVPEEWRKARRQAAA